jgi:hypothetical protein
VNIWSNAVLRFAKAVSVAEGSLKNHPEWNNPGDMTYAHGHQTLGTVNSDGVLKFANLADGWDALYHEVDLMFMGRSHIYKPTDTIEAVGLKYSNGNPNWAVDVADFLGVPITTTLQQCNV